MRLRTAVLAAGIALTTLATGADAKPACNLAEDPAGDTFLLRYQDQYRPQGAPYGPQEDAMDILSADIASDGKVVTAVIRVKNLEAAAPTSPGGVGYTLDFLTPKSEFTMYLRALKTGAGTTFEAGFKEPLPVGVTTVNTSLGTVQGVLDAAKNEVRITAPLSVFDSQGGIKSGNKLTLGEITTGRIAGPRTVFADVVVGEKSYTVGAASCVKPGK